MSPSSHVPGSFPSPGKLPTHHLLMLPRRVQVVQPQEQDRPMTGRTIFMGRTCLELHHSQLWEAPGGCWEKFVSEHPKPAGQTGAGLLPLLLCRQFPWQEAFFPPNQLHQTAPPANPHLPLQELWELKSVSFWGNKWCTTNSFFKKSNKATIYLKTTCLKGNHLGCLICESNPT